MHALLALDLLRGLVPATARGGRLRRDGESPIGGAGPASEPRTRRPAGWSSTALVLAAVLLAACARAGAREQTWPQSYGTTTCREWTREMSAQQRWIASTEILMHAQRGDGATSLPADALVETFRREISTTCKDEETGRLADVALGVYIIGRSRYRA